MEGEGRELWYDAYLHVVSEREVRKGYKLSKFDECIVVLCQDFGQLKYKNFQFLV